MSSEITRIDLADWEKSGEGAVGASYFHKNDPALMLKMNFSDAPVESWEREIQCAQAVYSLGLPTPKPGSIVTDGEHYGLMFQRIANKISYARAVSEHPERIEEYAKRFASIVKQMHATKADIEGLHSLKDYLFENIEKNPFHDEAFKAKARKLVESLPDSDTAIHGDLHFGNVIMADGKDYLIDLGNFCYGHYMYDIAMSVIVYDLADSLPEMFVKNYHCSPEQGKRFFEIFFREYFGESCNFAQLRKDVIPFRALRSIAAENEMGAPVPAGAEPEARQFLESL